METLIPPLIKYEEILWDITINARTISAKVACFFVMETMKSP